MSAILHFRVQATVIGQALVDAKWLECITSSDQTFRDMYALYRAGEVLLHCWCFQLHCGMTHGKEGSRNKSLKEYNYNDDQFFFHKSLKQIIK